MINEQRVRHSIIGGIALNIIVQVSMLLVLAYSGEWRVWRFLFNAVAQIDAIFVLSWFGYCLWRSASEPRQNNA